MTRLAAAAVAIVAFGTVGCAQKSRVAELHRIVFGTLNPGHPYTTWVNEAQIDLARAYSKGRGTPRNDDFGCSLALAALVAAEDVVWDNDGEIGREDLVGLRIRAKRAVDDVCARVSDREAALQLTACPVLGVTPRTLDVGNGVRLTLTPGGVRLENASGRHDEPWIVSCGDVVMSPRIVRATVPPGARYVPAFLQMFVWHQFVRNDGTSAGRFLEWKVMEILPSGLSQAEGTILLTYPHGYIWPVAPVPRAVAGGPSLRALPSGRVHWQFDGAPEFGSGSFGLFGGIP